MANYLDANPEEAERSRTCRDVLGLVPVVKAGRLVSYDHPDVAPEPTADMTAEDYVVGMEVLGFRFSVRPESDKRQLYEMTPIITNTPASWFNRALDLRMAFGRDRMREAAEFILARDGEAS